MTTLTATDARKGLFELLKSAKEKHEIYHIRYRNGDAVLMSQAEYDSLQETLELLSSPGFREDFERSKHQAAIGDTLSFEEVFFSISNLHAGPADGSINSGPAASWDNEAASTA